MLNVYLNLMTTYMSNCNYKGDYQEKNINGQLFFEFTKEEGIVRECWKYFNHPDWMQYCEDYCWQFNPVTLNEFFEPNLEKYIRLKLFYSNELYQKISDQKMDRSFGLPEDLTLEVLELPQKSSDVPDLTSILASKTANSTISIPSL